MLMYLTQLEHAKQKGDGPPTRNLPRVWMPVPSLQTVTKPVRPLETSAAIPLAAENGILDRLTRHQRRALLGADMAVSPLASR